MKAKILCCALIIYSLVVTVRWGQLEIKSRSYKKELIGKNHALKTMYLTIWGVGMAAAKEDNARFKKFAIDTIRAVYKNRKELFLETKEWDENFLEAEKIDGLVLQPPLTRAK